MVDGTELRVLAFGWWFPPCITPPGYKGLVFRLGGASLLWAAEDVRVLVREFAVITPGLAGLDASSGSSIRHSDARRLRGMRRVLDSPVTNPFLPCIDDRFLEVLFEKIDLGCTALVLGHCGGIARERIRMLPKEARDMVVVALPDLEDLDGVQMTYASEKVLAVRRCEVLAALVARAQELSCAFAR